MNVAETETALGKAGKSLAEVSKGEGKSGGRVELVSQVSERNENNSSLEFCTYRILTDVGTVERGKWEGKGILKERRRERERRSIVERTRSR